MNERSFGTQNLASLRCSGLPSPKGTAHLSPAFQCWVSVSQYPSQKGNNRSPGRKSWVIVIGASESRRDGTTLTSRCGCCFSRPPEMQALAPRRRQLYSRPALRDDSAQPRTERNRGPRFAPVLRELEWAAESWVADEKYPSPVGTAPDSPAFQGWDGDNNTSEPLQRPYRNRQKNFVVG